MRKYVNIFISEISELIESILTIHDGSLNGPLQSMWYFFYVI